MNQPQTGSKPQQQSYHTQIIQKQLNFSGKQKQIQKTGFRSRVASINKNIQIGCHNITKEASSQGFLSAKVHQMIKNGRVCIGSTVIQFSILIGLIVIQYISSTIKLLPLLAFIFLILILYPTLIVFIIQIQAVLQQNQFVFPIQIERMSSNGEDSKEESQLPTVSKINQQACKRANAKTKKIQYPSREPQQQNNTQQTIKKEVDHEQEQFVQHQQYQAFEQSLAFKKKILMTFKALKIVIGMSIASLCLFLFNSNQNQYHNVAIGLSTATYLLSITSSFFFFFYLKSINNLLRMPSIAPIPQKPQKPQQKIVAPCEQNPAYTKVSIDQLIQAKSLERRPTFSIDMGINSNKKHQDQFSDKAQFQRECKSQVQKQAAIKKQKKLSVLKPSKMAKSRKTSEKSDVQEMMERRKVQINSKKIQYFEYSQISPSQSVVDDDNSRAKPAVKSKFNLQKNKYMQHRMQVEAKILTSKILARQTSAKSQGCISNPSRSTPKQQVETRIDYFL